MAREESEKRGGEYSASVRRRRTTRIKKRKMWSLRRLVSIVGFAAAALAVLALISPQLPRGVRTMLFQALGFVVIIRDGLNGFMAGLVSVDLPTPLQGLGDIILLAAFIALLVLLFRVGEPEYVRKIDEMMMVMRTRSEAVEKDEEAQKEIASEAPTPPAIPYPMAYPQPGPPVETLQLSASTVVNAPRAQVWEVLNEVVYVPTCGEILDSVEVIGKLANALTWEGTVRTGRKEFPVEGTTTFYPPTRMEVACHRGALQGFKGVLSLVDVPEGTRLTETAEFDPGAIPDEYAPVANTLRAKGSEILIRDLEHFDQLVHALSTNTGEPETPE